MEPLAYSCKCGNLSVVAPTNHNINNNSNTNSREDVGRLLDSNVADTDHNTSCVETTTAAKVDCLGHQYPRLTLKPIGSNAKIESLFTVLTFTQSSASAILFEQEQPLSATPTVENSSEVLDRSNNNLKDGGDGKSEGDGEQPCQITFCLNCKSPQFIVANNRQEGSPQLVTYIITDFCVEKLAPDQNSSMQNQFSRESSVTSSITDPRMSLGVFDTTVAGASSTSSSDELDVIRQLEKISSFSSNESKLPPNLKIDWSKVQTRLRQVSNEVTAEIETAKRIEIQRLIQIENEKAVRRKSKLTSIFIAIEESMSELPRVVRRHGSITNATTDHHHQHQLYKQQILYYNPNSTINGDNTLKSTPSSLAASHNLSDEGIEDSADEQFELDENDPVGGSSGGGGRTSPPLVSSIVSDFELVEEEDYDDTMWTESSGGSSSGVFDGGNSTITSADPLGFTVRTKAVSKPFVNRRSFHGGDNEEGRGNDGFPAGSDSFGIELGTSQPIAIGVGPFQRHYSCRSASVALDEDEIKPNDKENLHTIMKELSRSVRIEPRDCFGELPDEYRKANFAQIMKSYTSSSEGVFEYKNN